MKKNIHTFYSSFKINSLLLGLNFWDRLQINIFWNVSKVSYAINQNLIIKIYFVLLFVEGKGLPLKVNWYFIAKTLVGNVFNNIQFVCE